MTILNHNTSNLKNFFNYNHDGGTLSTDCGLMLISDFIKAINFKEALKTIRFNDQRLYHNYSNESLTLQLIYQLTAGYDCDFAANILSKDECCSLFEDQNFASQSSLSRL